MKRNIVVICILTIIYLLFPNMIYASSYIEGSLQYEIINGSAIITYYSGDEQVVTIPWNFGDKKVVEISDSAFVDAKVDTIIVPENCNINEEEYWDVNIEYVDAFGEITSVKEKLEKDPKEANKIIKPAIKNKQVKKQEETVEQTNKSYTGYIIIGVLIIVLVFILRRYI